MYQASVSLGLTTIFSFMAIFALFVNCQRKIGEILTVFLLMLSFKLSESLFYDILVC